MQFIKISSGDFRPGAASVGSDDIKLRALDGEKMSVPFGAIVSINTIVKEKRSTIEDRFKGAAAGGVVGGIAAGAMAGGLTGPAGAVIGAAAGAALALRRSFVTCRVELRCGLSFVGEAQKSTWTMLQSLSANAPPENVRPVKLRAIEPAGKRVLTIRLPSFRLPRGTRED